jgi:hypothetical protein
MSPYDEQPLPDVDDDAPLGAAPVMPGDGTDPYPADRAVDQDRPDEDGEL